VRGEGEETLTELVRNANRKAAFSKIKGISFRHGENIFQNASRPLIENLEDLPFPGYHLVKDLVHQYHFVAMSGPGAPYILIEGSRGCPNECTFCTQWRHWQGKWRLKSAKRVADEIEFCYRNFGSRFVWLTDDNFASIVAAVEEGRGIFQNIKKYLVYLLSANVGEVLIMFIAGLLGMALPLVAIHLLWVNLTTDGLPALALAVDPADPDIMLADVLKELIEICGEIPILFDEFVEFFNTKVKPADVIVFAGDDLVIDFFRNDMGNVLLQVRGIHTMRFQLPSPLRNVFPSP
jgi:hypothetical protein